MYLGGALPLPQGPGAGARREGKVTGPGRGQGGAGADVRPQGPEGDADLEARSGAYLRGSLLPRATPCFRVSAISSAKHTWHHASGRAVEGPLGI